MTRNDWAKVDEELDFISDAAESAIGTESEEDLTDALEDIKRSLYKIKAIKNGTVAE